MRRFSIKGAYAVSKVNTTLIGLVLAGGQSRRMGQDKALMRYQGRALIDNASLLLQSASCDKVLISRNAPGFLNDKIEGAQALCLSENKPVARLVAKGLSRIGRPLEDISKTIENAGRLEVYKLEKNVSILATIAGAAPMIGFLGTVIGMILSIFEISNAGGNIDMQLLAGGLYTAMTTTVAGLIVGIVGYITYNHLVVKTNKVVYQMEAISLAFFDLLNEPV